VLHEYYRGTSVVQGNRSNEGIVQGYLCYIDTGVLQRYMVRVYGIKVYDIRVIQWSSSSTGFFCSTVLQGSRLSTGLQGYRSSTGLQVYYRGSVGQAYRYRTVVLV